jgi:oxaloacetate decarboxylase alpha subunit
MAKIKISELVLRDAHQSLHATRMVTSDMLPIASQLDAIGFWSLETWGGATFDSCIRFLNEDPWERIRSLKKAMPNTPQQMLLRGQSILGYRHYADDVVEKCVERMAINGVDVFRVFDALNDPRNFMVPMKAVKKAGKHAQAAISYTVSPVHTTENYVKLAKELAAMGADSICIKDMASLLSPYTAYELVKALKKAVDLPIHIHSHSTTGMSVATLVKAVEAGAEMIDTAISSMSMGPSHSPTETLVEIFKGTEFDTGLDMDALLDIATYFRDVVRPKYAQFESSFSGADARILKAAIPGGMLSNLESQLRQQKAFHRLDEVLKENAQVCKDFGYPPLVTPTSQIVGTQAVLNVLMGRYKNLTAESMNLLAGNYGKTPGAPDPELVKVALKGLSMDNAVTERPADLLTNELPKIEEELKQKLGTATVNIDDVMTYAMFPQVALKFFETRAKGPVVFTVPSEAANAAAPAAKAAGGPVSYVINVDDKDYKVVVGDNGIKVDGKDYKVAIKAEGAAPATSVAPAAAPAGVETPVQSPVAGVVLKFLRANGDHVDAHESVVLMESMKMELEIKSKVAGVITYVVDNHAHVAAEQTLAIVR